jgi:hypothetical protein
LVSELASILVLLFAFLLLATYAEVTRRLKARPAAVVRVQNRFAILAKVSRL